MSRLGTRRGVALVVAVVAFSVLGVASDSVGAEASTGGFDDVPANTFYSVPVSSLAARGVFNGTECAPRGFCPEAPLDRKTMAVWIVRMIDNADPAPLAATRFTTDVPAGSFHAPFIERMAELKITFGCDPNDRTRFCPDRFVTRGQMAAFLTRAYNLPPAANPAAFVDVAAGAWYAQDVANLAATGITKGCGDGTRFCPSNDVTRGEMATFLYRADSGLQEVIDAPPDEQEKATETKALAALYNATNGANWTNNTNWLSNRPLNEWHGIWTDSNGRVTHLILSDNQLSGGIPPELGDLTNLEWLGLSFNQLSGGIPPELGNLTNLEGLDLWDNQLSGGIPPELGDLTNLQSLNLWDNQLSGGIPPELGDLANLGDLGLSNNQLSGVIPSELGDLTNLRDLWLYGNELIGAIPSELGDLTNLGSLGLSFNQLSGVIPSELGDLTNLRDLWLSNNELIGAIPSELGDLTNLGSLDLSFNQLSGVIPSELGDLTNLGTLNLIGNRLTGMLPSSLTRLAGLDNFGFRGNTGLCAPAGAVFQAWLGNIPNNGLGIPHGPNCADTAELSDRDALVALYNATNGANWTNNTNWLSNRPLNEWHGISTDSNGRVTHLDLHGNGLSGVMPPELGNLTNLQSLNLWDNQLSGGIPSELGDLTNLQRLGLWDNQLSGGIPPELGDLANLRSLWLSGNGLIGAIPSELGDLANLQSLDLSDNQLSGAIPSVLGDLTNLEWLDLSFNQLSGAIPSVLGDLTNLQSLNLWFNQLSGGIPSVLGDLANLQSLDLSDNQLSGRIPSELGDLANLRSLWLSGNGLIGAIPSELGDLANLETLSLSFNQLSGVIPSELGDLANLQSLNLAGNQLSGVIPSELGDLANLQSLDLAGNQLSGVIPSELGDLANLQSLDLSFNQLSGVIPSELGDLANLQLLSLSDNQLSGVIPSELGDLANLQWLGLGGNQLSGAIPSELGRLTNLEELYLSDNPNLSGALPGSFAGLTSLYQMWVYGTGLCAPTDSVFQSWLAGVDDKDGVVNCTEPMVEPLGGPPPSLGLDPFYAKYLDAGGLPIVSSSAVPDEALYRARDIIGEMLSDRADLIATMAEKDVRVVVQGESMHATELPEVEDTPNWRGFFHDPLVVTSEENLLCYDTDPHRYGEVLIHELAHAVHFVGIEKRRDRTFSRRLDRAFTEARAAGLWDYTYAATNSVEYWAEGVEVWFGINDVPGLSGNDVNTRRELEEYDPTLANLVTEVFGEATVSSSCQEKHPSDRRTTLVQGVLTGPDGQPVDEVWIGARSAEQVDSRWGITGWAGLMGTFWMRVHDGTYTLAVYAAPEGTCAGWYDGDGGVTTDHDQAARLTVEGTAVEDLNIRLPVSPEDLPSVQC